MSMSRTEQMIDDIESYIEGCKYATFSSTKIIVDKDEIGELLADLRKNTPEEIKRYQKIISNKEGIIADAQKKADEIIKGAQVEKSELISEHQIMQQAYEQANEMIDNTSVKAQSILNDAISNANDLRSSAASYTDEQLGNIEALLTSAIKTTKDFYTGLIGSLEGYLDTVRANREEMASMLGKPSKPAKAASAMGTAQTAQHTTRKSLATETAEPAGFSEVDVSDEAGGEE